MKKWNTIRDWIRTNPRKINWSHEEHFACSPLPTRYTCNNFPSISKLISLACLYLRFSAYSFEDRKMNRTAAVVNFESFKSSSKSDFVGSYFALNLLLIAIAHTSSFNELAIVLRFSSVSKPVSSGNVPKKIHKEMNSEAKEKLFTYVKFRCH